MEHIDELKSLLSTPKRIAITTHQKPDGDAMGSSLAWYHYLTQLGHKVKVVVPTDYPEFLKWLPGSDQVLVGPYDPDMASWTFDGADLIFCLDFNALKRIKELGPMVKDAEGTKIMIDHHLEPEDFAHLSFVDTEASSAAEMVYRLIDAMGDRDKVTLEMAQALYTGIMTDTGSFRFTNTTAAVHKIVAHMIEVGVEVNTIHESIFSNSSEERLRFVGHCLTNCLHVLPEYNTAYIKLDKPVFKQFNVKSGDTEGLVNYALGIKGVNLGILITTQDDLVKMSFRSRGEVAASEFAKEFNGGGHFYAAGGRSTDSLEDTEKRLIQLLEQRKTQLVSS